MLCERRFFFPLIMAMKENGEERIGQYSWFII